MPCFNKFQLRWRHQFGPNGLTKAVFYCLPDSASQCYVIFFSRALDSSVDTFLPFPERLNLPYGWPKPITYDHLLSLEAFCCAAWQCPKPEDFVWSQLLVQYFGFLSMHLRYAPSTITCYCIVKRWSRLTISMSCCGSDTSQIMEALMLTGTRTRCRKRRGGGEVISPQSAVRMKRKLVTVITVISYS